MDQTGREHTTVIINKQTQLTLMSYIKRACGVSECEGERVAWLDMIMDEELMKFAQVKEMVQVKRITGVDITGGKQE